MASSMNRRAWLKTSTLITSGLTLTGTLSGIAAPAAPAITRIRSVSDAEFERGAQPALKARLFANENPFGPSQKAKQAIIDF